jgi:hypothetical protein
LSDSEIAETGGVWNFVRREPLIHFLGLAALLFIANAVFSGDEREVIEVDLDTQAFLVKAQEDLLLRPLTEEDRQGVIDNFIEEEVFVREARARGFDNSSRIRTLMIQNMRFFLSSDIPAPSDEAITAHYENNPDRFTTAPSITYEHVLFRDPTTVPDGTLDRLNQGADFRQLGDRDAIVQPLLREVDQRSIAATFGPDVAPAVLAIDDDQWHGPFASGNGAHFLRIREKHESRRPALEDIRNWVENDWLSYTSRKKIDDALDEMLENYIIDIEQPGEDRQ